MSRDIDEFQSLEKLINDVSIFYSEEYQINLLKQYLKI